MRGAPAVALVFVVLAASGCPTPDAEPPVVREPGPPPTAVDTTTEALQAHLQQSDYATSWQHWPNLDPFYPGQEPHGALLRTYLNSVAYDAVQRGDTLMPVGSVIVKESYTPARELINVTVMSKASGYAPDAGDWYWLAAAPDGSVEASGRVAMCRDCHAAGRDYVMTGR
jgi:hypothetical protein